MQFDQLENEDEEFRHFLTEVLERWVVRLGQRHPRFSRRHNPRRWTDRKLTRPKMNVWLLNPSRVGHRYSAGICFLTSAFIIGFCLKTKRLDDPSTNEKVFINVCTSPQITAPREITEEELIEIVKSEDPGRYRVPISLGEPVADLDKRDYRRVCPAPLHHSPCV